MEDAEINKISSLMFVKGDVMLLGELSGSIIGELLIKILI